MEMLMVGTTYEEVGEDARLVDVAEEGVEDLAGDEGDAELEEDGVVVGRQDAARHRAIHGCRPMRSITR
jgi:hypothetical protein